MTPNKELEKGIRRVLYRKQTGFRVTIGSKQLTRRNKGKRKGVTRYGKARMAWGGFDYHANRQGKEKPVLIWAEGGTKDRYTKTSAKFGKLVNFRKKKGHATGRMRKYGFMEKTKAQVQDKVTEELRKQMKENIIKTAKKYGCS